MPILLNPIVEKISRGRATRFVAVLFILFVFLTLAVGGMILLVPALSREVVALANNLPDYIDFVLEAVNPYLVMLQERLNGEGYAADIQTFLKDHAGKIAQLSRWSGQWCCRWFGFWRAGRCRVFNDVGFGAVGGFFHDVGMAAFASMVW